MEQCLDNPNETGTELSGHLRVMIVTDSFHPQADSAASHLYGRACRWAADGHNVDVVAGPGPSLAGGRDRLHVTRSHAKQNSRSGSLLRRVLRNSTLGGRLQAAGCRRPRPDVILSSMPPLSVGLAGLELARHHSAPLVVEVRDLWPDSVAELTMIRRGPLIRRMAAQERRIYQAATRLSTVTESIAQRVQSRSGRNDVTVVHTGADTTLFNPRSPDPVLLKKIGISTKHVVGYLGTIGRAQDLRTLCSIAPDLAELDVTLLIVGGGAELSSLKKLIQRRRLQNVRFVGVQPRAAMPAWWALCTAAVVPLRGQPVLETVRPMKMYEGMAMGIPLIVASLPGESTKWMEAAGAGLIVPPEDKAKLLKAIETLVGNPYLQTECCQAGLREAARWTRDHQADATMAVLQTAVRDFRRATPPG